MICKSKAEFKDLTRDMLDTLGCGLAECMFNINSGNIIAQGENVFPKAQYLKVKTENCVKVVSYKDIEEIWIRPKEGMSGEDGEETHRRIGFDLT